MTESPFAWRQLATVLSAAGVIGLAIGANPFMQASETASQLDAIEPITSDDIADTTDPVQARDHDALTDRRITATAERTGSR